MAIQIRKRTKIMTRSDKCKKIKTQWMSLKAGQIQLRIEICRNSSERKKKMKI